MVCRNCGTVSVPKEKNKGSGMIELILWICFIIPGVIYSCWRVAGRYKACPACGSLLLVPQDSPEGQRLLGK